MSPAHESLPAPPLNAPKKRSAVATNAHVVVCPIHVFRIIVALIRRHVNDDPIEDIIADYKRHVDWKSEDKPGGYEELNVRFIKEFDLSLLTTDSVIFEEGFEREDPLPKQPKAAAASFRRRARALMVAGHMSVGLIKQEGPS